MIPKVIFCALARDCRKRIKGNMTAFRKLQAEFPQARWIFVENDSVDGTRELLEKWAQVDSRIVVLGKNIGEPTIPKSNSSIIPGYSLHRIERMAFFRNIHLKWIEENTQTDDNGVVVVIDPDVRSIPVSHIKRSIHSLPEKQVLTALGLRWASACRLEFHDAYAYRERGDLSPQTIKKIISRRKTLADKFKKSERFAVRSNFNGLGIYPLGAIRGCRYQALKNADLQVQAECEHVSLHDQLSQKGIQILIDPTLKIFYNSWLGAATAPFRRVIRKFLI
jgi:hypothetical protein